jgi:hypothetical protein
MENSSGMPTLASPVRGYPRPAVDEFVASAAHEQAALETAIADAQERTRRARAAIGTHRVMVAMLLEAQRHLDEIRAAAETEATDIIARAEREAEAIISAARPPILDLSGAESRERAVSQPITSSTSSMSDPWSPGFAAPSEPGAESSEYFDFLRGALVDDEPLGPRGE